MFLTKLFFGLLILAAYNLRLHAAMAHYNPFNPHQDVYIGCLASDKQALNASPIDSRIALKEGMLVLVPIHLHTKLTSIEISLTEKAPHYHAHALPDSKNRWICGKIKKLRLDIANLQVGNFDSSAHSATVYDGHIYEIETGSDQTNSYFSSEEIRIPSPKLLEQIQTNKPRPPHPYPYHLIQEKLPKPAPSQASTQNVAQENNEWDIAVLIDMFSLGMKIVTVAAVMGCISTRCK